MKQQMEAEAAAEEGEEEGAAPAEGEEGAGGEGNPDGAPASSAPKVDKESLSYILINCSPFQKINFAMIIMVYCGQLLKYAYDFYAEAQLERIVNPTGYIDFSSLSTFNNICMFLDSIIINIGSISLLKYTQQAMPGLEAIILTVTEFFKGTFKKTMTMIILTYMLFGFMSHFILSYYQYGFFYIGYALLRSCIVFLNGFIINEQRILLSSESVENLMNYNGFGLTFSTMVIVNILIRQVMINIVAIFMHNDYHSAKIIARDLQKQRRLELEEKIKSQVKKDYISEMMRQYIE
uniref:Uncharacterized protein n=1 Tax=Strombidium inclinatum TaxID=197538 RepID=A0A7S3N2V3_9SPIT|mmetsp:Transcript_4491/g.6731  ORF Transcript_4491/g.6731 Transcript_4491/m.6731 type:complete len:293 (+) Transcript_4491:1797-2675(+)